MANLTEISIGVRKTGLFLAILVGIFLLLRAMISFAIIYYRATHQPPPAPPDVRYGKLAKPKFIKAAHSSSGLTFTLQNVEGKPPETTDAAKVYSLPKKLFTFESDTLAKNLAIKLGFEGEPTIDSVYYYYAHQSDPKLTLFIDSIHLNFQLRYNYLDNPEIFQLGQLASKEQAMAEVKNYLESADIIDESILQGKITSDLLIFDGQSKKLVPASSLSNTQVVRINFFRNDIDELKVVPDEFDKSYTYVLFAQNTGIIPNNMLEISYIYWPITLADFGTYPLITGDAAYQALVDGTATVVNKGENSEAIVIRKIYLAYYDSAEPQLYMQPIFVFEGDNNFVAYLPAIAPAWLE